jgi:hypothetical protein
MTILVTYRYSRDFRSPKEDSTAPVNPLDDRRLEQIQHQVINTSAWKIDVLLSYFAAASMQVFNALEIHGRMLLK